MEKARKFQKTSTYASLTILKSLTGWVNKKKKMWKILKEMGITDHFTFLLRNLYAGQEVTVRTGLVPNWERSMTRLYIVTLLI